MRFLSILLNRQITADFVAVVLRTSFFFRSSQSANSQLILFDVFSDFKLAHSGLLCAELLQCT